MYAVDQCNGWRLAKRVAGVKGELYKLGEVSVLGKMTALEVYLPLKRCAIANEQAQAAEANHHVIGPSSTCEPCDVERALCPLVASSNPEAPRCV